MCCWATRRRPSGSLAGSRRSRLRTWPPRWSRLISPAIGGGSMLEAAEPPRRILLTGASGFVGRHLRAALATAYPAAALVTDAFDLRDGEAVAASVAAVQPDVC